MSVVALLVSVPIEIPWNTPHITRWQNAAWSVHIRFLKHTESRTASYSLWLRRFGSHVIFHTFIKMCVCELAGANGHWLERTKTVSVRLTAPP